MSSSHFSLKNLKLILICLIIEKPMCASTFSSWICSVFIFSIIVTQALSHHSYMYLEDNFSKTYLTSIYFILPSPYLMTKTKNKQTNVRIHKRFKIINFICFSGSIMLPMFIQIWISQLQPRMYEHFASKWNLINCS